MLVPLSETAVSKTQCCNQEEPRCLSARPSSSSPTSSLSGPHRAALVFALQSRALVSLRVRGAGEDLEDDLHVVGGAEAPGEAHHVLRAGGGDEVVVLAGLELQGVRHWGERSEGQGEDPEDERGRELERYNQFYSE